MSHRTDNGLVRYVSRSYRSIPTDVAIVASLVVLADVAILLLPGSVGFLRVALGLPLVFFVPGYALLTVLFPEKSGAPSDATADRRSTGSVNRIRRGDVDAVERVALSFGTSLALVPVVVLLGSTVFGTLSVLPVLATINVVVGCLLAVGTARRRATPEPHRFEVSTHRIRRSVFGAESLKSLVRNGVLAVSVVLVASTLIYAIAVPQTGQSFSQLQVLTESGSGDLVTSGYPANVTAGEAESTHVRVENHENERTTYALVVELQRVRAQGGSSTVVEEQRLAQMEQTLPPGETWEPRVEFTPELMGSDLRLTYLLYEGDVPDDPSRENAYRSVYTPINVTDASAT